MGTISTGVGLISGLDISSLISQLMAIESRPLELLQTRITATQQQQTAYTQLSALLLASKSAVHRLSLPSSFTVKSATSSDESVITASASEGAPIGSYSFLVKSLVTTHQLVSGGFADRNSTPVGAGTLTFEIGEGRLNKTTSLDTLKGFQGIRRGVIRITDRTGASADIDLRTAFDINDVLEAINSQNQVNVRARFNDDKIEIIDETGETTGRLVVEDVAKGKMAAALGIAMADADGDGVIVGSDLIYLTESTKLAALNDGMGIRINNTENDLHITLRDGGTVDVNFTRTMGFDTKLGLLNDGKGVRAGTIGITLKNGDYQTIDITGSETIQEVANAIKAAFDADPNDATPSLVSVVLIGSKISIIDNSNGTVSNFKIEDVDGYAAADLGILADTQDKTVTGSEIYRFDKVGVALRAIELADEQGRLHAAISDDGNGIVLTDTTGGGGTISVVEADSQDGSWAARDLGFLDGGYEGGRLNSRHLIAGFNTVLLSSLNGGSGVDAGVIQFTLRDGTSTGPIDLTDAQTLQDIIDAINAVNGLAAQIDAGATGLIIEDTTGGSGTLAVTDVSGSTAADLHLATDSAGRLASGDLQLQYINENTLLSGLNNSKGIDFADFRITASDGQTGIIRLNEALHKTVGDAIKAINDLGIGVTAQINANGDGIELVDSGNGAGILTVTEVGDGTAAKDLGILGSAVEGVLTGTFAKTIEVDANDTLDDLVAKINDASIGITASVINDGTDYAPYRLTLTSGVTGAKGIIAFNAGSTGLALDTLSEGQDAVLLVGDLDSANPIIIHSSSNTIKDVVDGLTLNLLGVSSSPVQVTIARNTDQIISDIKTFINTVNDSLGQINALTSYDAETEEGGMLLGDYTVQNIESRLLRVITSAVNQSNMKYKRLSDIGIMVSSDTLNGAGLTLQRTISGVTIDGEAKLRKALEEDPEAVKELFTLITKELDENGEEKSVKYGILARLDDELDAITNSVDGVITRQNDKLQDKVDLYNDRIDEMTVLLNQKEARLYKQFQAMESALAALQTQQSALASLSSLTSYLYSGSG